MPGAEDNKETPGNQPGADDKSKETPAAGSAGGDGGGEDDLKEFADPEKALAEIKKLRKENGDRRTKTKDAETKFNQLTAKFEKLSKLIGGEEEVDPEVKLQNLQQKTEALEMELSISKLSRDLNIPVDQDDYFRFLLSKAMGQLEEGQELGDEEMNEIVAKVQAIASPGAKSGGTGLSGKKPDPSGGGDSYTAEQFKNMSTTEKSALYQKNPALYEKLRSEAKF